MYVNIEISTKTYLRKWLEFDLQEKSVANQSSLIGRSICLVLERNTPHNYCDFDQRYRVDGYKDIVRAKIPLKYTKFMGSSVGRTQTIFLNKLWDFLFYRESYAVLDLLSELSPDRIYLRQLIDEYLDRYSISNSDLDMRTFRQRYYRHRKKMEMEI